MGLAVVSRSVMLVARCRSAMGGSMVGGSAMLNAGWSVTAAESVSVVVTAVAVAVPTVGAMIGCVVTRTSVVEVMTVGVVSVDAENKTAVPIHWTVEIFAAQENAVLRTSEHVLQILITMIPVDAEDIVADRKTGQVVEVDFIHGIVLIIVEIQLVCHLVAQIECLFLCTSEIHCLC